ncbi:MAG: LEPR-XLL domain-containing protein [Planctomycetaceae bacterium]
MTNYEIEQLESRLLLSATAVLKNGTLLINGDASNDTIAVKEWDGEFTIVVYHDTDGDGFVDASLGLFNIADIKNIKINSKGGDDLVHIEKLTTEGWLPNISIMTGGGDDIVQVDSSIIGALTISTGSGNDYVNLFENNFGPVSINTGGGNDVAHVYAAAIDGALSANLGSGNDLLSLHLLSTIDSVTTAVKVNGGWGRRDVLIDGKDFGEIPIPSVRQFESVLSDFPPGVYEDLIDHFDMAGNRTDGNF